MPKLQRGVERCVFFKKLLLSSVAGKVPTVTVTRDSFTCSSETLALVFASDTSPVTVGQLHFVPQATDLIT